MQYNVISAHSHKDTALRAKEEWLKANPTLKALVRKSKSGLSWLLVTSSPTEVKTNLNYLLEN
jgi:hypothetical protein